ncbi:hypothetical protein EHS25_009630 [Saitozyma podzolica]|uniref:Uncharacterized protein n=1 Tax=Saitozyma podzolica TaxID=1890683 RepID=A0A427YJT2_9TREE|nr:hypothetical protein EHS25_009630 [Saitozyma podzolica]
MKTWRPPAAAITTIQTINLLASKCESTAKFKDDHSTESDEMRYIQYDIDADSL